MKIKIVLLVVVLVGVGCGVVFWLSKKSVGPFWKTLLTSQLAEPTVTPQYKEELKETKIVEVKIGDKFFVTLDANPTTGFQWEVDFDSSFFKLVHQEYTPSQKDLIGAGGTEVFTFQALKPGETEIKFSYLRPWEKEASEQLVYKVIIE